MLANTNQEVAAKLRDWVGSRFSGSYPFDWPTDGCSYEQHIRFAIHRNEHYEGSTLEDFKDFVLAYARSLESA